MHRKETNVELRNDSLIALLMLHTQKIGFFLGVLYLQYVAIYFYLHNFDSYH